MGSTLLGGPTVTNIKPPAPLFPGMTQTYTGALQGSGILPASLGTLTQAAQTGLPTDVGPAFEAMKAAMARSTQEGRTALRESYGARGLSGGTDLFKAGSDFEAQNQANLNNILAQYTMQAQEAAAQRRMSAAGAGAQLYGEPALAFAPTQVVGQKGGLLGPLLQTFSTLFPNFDLGSLLKKQPPTTPAWQGPINQPDLSTGVPPPTYTTVGTDTSGTYSNIQGTSPPSGGYGTIFAPTGGGATSGTGDLTDPFNLEGSIYTGDVLGGGAGAAGWQDYLNQMG